MSINPGTRIGPYEITSPLGEGGMGVVYRAHDTKLGRDVAIKALPDAFANDSDRLQRFQREAQVLASLNHPNIAQIYGLEESDKTRCIVMELVEGETLQERLKRGPIPIDEALPIAKQIAEALEAAHEKGIIHRDLKPANIKLTPDGTVKVLDFGLAKPFQEQRATALSNSPTLLNASMPGVILGTAAYMSPEQARGENTNERSDLFSFGCVLYEMLTGQQAFQGGTVSDILAAVLRIEPDFGLLPRELNPRLNELLRRRLDKNPKRRLQAAGDLQFELETVAADPRRKSSGVVEPTANASKRERLVWIVFAFVVLIVAALAIVHFREVPAPAPPEMRTDIITPPTTDPTSFALSPDGRQIVFLASTDGQPRLWLRALDKTTSQPLAGTEGGSYPFWSPDSRSIGFFDGSNLKRIDLAGGAPQTLTQAANRGGAWSPDGTILFARSTTSPLFRMSASGGEVVAVTKLDKQASHRFPQFLPDSRQFVFYAQGPPETGGIYLGSLDSPESKRLTAADTAGAYLPTGWLLFVRGGTLLARRLDLVRKELIGDPVTVADSVITDSLTNSSGISIAGTGVLAYRTGGPSGRHQLIWFDRAGKNLGALGAPDESLTAPRLSPDGRRVALYRVVQGNPDIWLMDGDRTIRFTFATAFDQFPAWSPDGSRILFRSNRKGNYNLYQKQSTGAGTEELLLESPQNKGAGNWSPDGRFLSFMSADPQSGWDLWMLPMQGDRKPFVFLKTNFDERNGMFSPDGRWVAYMSNESGRFEIYVRPFLGSGGQWQISTASGTYPVWAASGKELYYTALDGTLMAAPISIQDAAVEPGRPVALFQTRIYGGGDVNLGGPQYDVSRDGRFLINTVLENVAASPITLLQNWKPKP
jgi:serine/threonine protein kinase